MIDMLLRPKIGVRALIGMQTKFMNIPFPGHGESGSWQTWRQRRYVEILCEWDAVS